MNDEIIRTALLRHLARKYAASDTVIVNELKVARGSARLDLAVLDDRINGFEIKSDHDTVTQNVSKSIHDRFDRLASPFIEASFTLRVLTPIKSELASPDAFTV